jgi:rubrerythrin
MPTITPNQAIRNAVAAELASARFYALLADSTEDPTTRAFLEEMADLERKHARDIETMGAKLVDGPLAERADSDVSMVETLPDWKYVDDITLPQALEVALQAEQQAALYYDALADFLEGPVMEFFQQLSKQEEEHAVALQEKREQLGFA